jgi:hypothetical protein
MSALSHTEKRHLSITRAGASDLEEIHFRLQLGARKVF